MEQDEDMEEVKEEEEVKGHDGDVEMVEEE
jgi:hypothetical protein